jgi:hypothetical protein
MPAGSETLQEIKFWVELEGVLQNITDQLETPEARTCSYANACHLGCVNSGR